jgi:hypothetical protein
MCGTFDPGSCIRCVLGFGIKTGYDRLGDSLSYLEILMVVNVMAVS